MTFYGKIDRLTGTAALEAARKMMDLQGLAQPPVPDKMVADLQQRSPHLFATCELPNGLYAIDQLVDNTAAGSPDEFVALGFDGHGIQSWAFHFALIEGSLAVFLQLQWAAYIWNHKLPGTGSRVVLVLWACCAKIWIWPRRLANWIRQSA